jgi:hypothetical protein
VKALTTHFLENFYTLYLMKLPLFQSKDMVLNTIFKPLKIDPAIYDNPTYGWATPDTFGRWVRFALKGKHYAVDTQEYEDLLTELNLKEKQVVSLAFERSTLYNSIAALNGTIKFKVAATPIRYSGYCQDFCTDEQLASMQIAASFLTGTDPIFPNLALNTTIRQLNGTFDIDLEYPVFC